ncbi:MAG: aminotransferase class I/II-fold pyridoxal phosphate-dependent enzyme, partial [Firmicutes bacterium]|nr:aminotransferase class I/II-fold pyridoxal phosphate-dependent enzyme [Bacillota bacterium]
MKGKEVGMMNYVFSDEINMIGPSPIRASVKYMGLPGYISLGSGSPDASTFPVEEFKELCSDILDNLSGIALQYNNSEGYGPLREKVAARLKDELGIGRDFDQCCIMTGGQQAIDLTAKIFINPGDTVICEKPSFIGAMNSFRAYGAKLAGIPMDEEGMIPGLLEEELKS